MPNYKERLKGLSVEQLQWLNQQLLQRQVNSKRDQKRLVAYLKSDAEVNQVALTRFLKERMPAYMVPAHLEQLKEFPTLPNGKIDRQQLASKVLSEPTKSSRQVGQSAEPKTAIEAQLLEIWSEVLGVEQIGVEDNFFDIGGDSILSIQIVAKAKKVGIRLSSNQIFEHQTVRTLALFARVEQKESLTVKSVFGDFPLHPIQQWFFEEHRTAPHYWNQGMCFYPSEKMKMDVLSKAILHLLDQHPALRTTFSPDHLLQQIPQSVDPEKVYLHELDLTQESTEKQRDRINHAITDVQSFFDLVKGPLFGVLYVHNAPTQADACYILVHHLIVDVVSWTILVSDLERAYQQILSEEPLQLGTPTMPYPKWAQQLSDWADEGRFDSELAYWQGQSQTTLPTDYDQSLPIEEQTVETIQFKMDQTLTDQLLTKAINTYHTGVDDLLIASLILTVQRFYGIFELCLGLERHGRLPLYSEIDLSQSIGWMTSFFPLTLSVESKDRLGVLIKEVKEQLNAVPNGGIGYGILRYQNRQELLTQQPPVIFNYLGKQNKKELGVLGEGGFVFEHLRAKQSERHRNWELNAMVIDRQLQLNWSYSNSQYRKETIRVLVETYEKALRDIVLHCLDPEAGGYTPSDFPDADLSQDELDHLLGEMDI